MLKKFRRLDSRGRIGSLKVHVLSGRYFKGRLEIQEKHRFNMRVSNQVSFDFLMLTRIWCVNLSLRREEFEIYQVTNLLVPSVLRSIGGNGKFLWLWKEGHKIRYFPIVRSQ